MMSRHTGYISLVIGMTVVQAACVAPPMIEPDFDPAQPEISIVSDRKDGSIYQQSSNRFFFEDIRARRVGDVINVILDEKTAATKSASTNANKGTSIDLPGPSLFGGGVSLGGRELLSNEITASTDFTGTGGSSQSNRLSGSVAVIVEQVLPNGNLWIRGQKVLTLNQGSEVVRVAGLIRTADITPGNTIMSTQIADAKISYGGNGLIADSNRAGWLTRVFTSPLWPF